MNGKREIEITPYTDELVKAHEEFSQKVWPGKKRRRSERYNRWKFRGNEKGDVNGLMLAVSNGKVIGQLGLIPVKLKYEKELFDAQWACDLIVDPEVRKSGIGNDLFEEGMKRNVITLGNNPSPRAESLMLAKGFKPMKSARNMVFPLDPSHLLNWIMPSKLKFLSGLSGSLLKPYYNSKRKKFINLKSEFHECDTETVSKFISRCQTERKDAEIFHDMEFLKWRKEGIENYSHELDSMVKPEKNYAVHSHFLPYYNVYDWHCDDENTLKEMLTVIFNSALKSKAGTIQIMANNEEEVRMLKSFGFISARNTETVIQYSPAKSIDDAEYFYFTLYDTDINL